MAVIMQIYPSQWGKLKNITAKAEYYKDLGVEMIWISPCYPHSGYDNGYDIKHYEDIAPEYGTLEDMAELIDTYHANGIKVLLDLVINHCSIEHPIYKMALKGDKSAQAMFHMYDEPQNDWEAIFGGSVWKYEPTIDKYVFHAFTEGQIDWNFDNEEVWEFWENVIAFWLEDMNVDGFRIDAQTHMGKNDWDTPKVKHDPGAPYRCAPKLHEYMKHLADIVYSIKEDAFLMGEANGIDAHGAKQWIDEGLLDCVIQFEHLAPLKLEGTHRNGSTLDCILKMKEWSDVLGEDNLAYIQSHDIACAYSVLSLDHEDIARLVFSQQGHKLLYNGQETGMENKIWKDLREIEEPETKGRFEKLIALGLPIVNAAALAAQLSRENARQPINWDNNPVLHDLYKELIAKDKKEREQYA